MTAQHVGIFIAGSAVWAAPARVAENTLRTPYQASLMNRFTFEDGQVHYLKLHMIGVDEIDNGGAVVVGNGTMQFEDADGDLLRGESDWFLPEGPDERGRTPENLGTMTFSSGTGKWRDTTGTAQLRCYGMYADPEQVIPPVADTKYFAVFEGDGRIDAPGLPG
ncbi:MAG: hypothetical protein JWQ48_2172 [Conexibacter sp.]|jgi:hypothetical protein|nr:hypothetical protein [Conexibacter sp.]